MNISRDVILENDSLTIHDSLEISAGGKLELKNGLLIVKGKTKTSKGQIRGSKNAAIIIKTKGLACQAEEMSSFNKYTVAVVRPHP